MKTWQTKKLEAIAEFSGGLWTGKKEPFKKIKVLRNTNFRNTGILDYSNVAELLVEERQLKSRLLEEGDIVLEKSGGGPGQPVGRVVYFDSQDEYSYSNFTCRVRIKDKMEVLPKFLWLFLLREYICGATEKMQKQTTGIRNLIMAEYKNLEIPLPPLDEQKKIVKILDEKMGKIAEAKRLRAEALADTEKILSQTLHEIFEEGKKGGWEEKTIGDLFVFNYGKGLSKFDRSENGKYIAYGANGELGKTDKFLTEGESIIVGRKGSAGEVTRASGKFWPTDVTYYITEDKEYNINFAFYLFKYLDFTRYAKGVKPGINRNEIYSLKFYYPSLAEQQKIVTKLDALSEKVRTLRDLQTSQLADLKSLERAYLREAFRGEL